MHGTSFLKRNDVVVFNLFTSQKVGQLNSTAQNDWRLAGWLEYIGILSSWCNKGYSIFFGLANNSACQIVHPSQVGILHSGRRQKLGRYCNEWIAFGFGTIFIGFLGLIWGLVFFVWFIYTDILWDVTIYYVVWGFIIPPKGDDFPHERNSCLFWQLVIPMTENFPISNLYRTFDCELERPVFGPSLALDISNGTRVWKFDLSECPKPETKWASRL